MTLSEQEKTALKNVPEVTKLHRFFNFLQGEQTQPPPPVPALATYSARVHAICA